MPLKKTIFVALMVIVVLLIPLTVLLLLPDTAEESPEVTDTPSVQVLFDQNHTEHAEAVRFTKEEGAEISITRTEDGWQITDRPGLPVNPKQMDALLSSYRQMLALRTITESCDDLAEYGLDTPVLSVTLTDHGIEKTYLFGDQNTYYEGYYCTVKGSAAVYLVDYAYVTAFDVTVDDLLLTEELPDLSAPSALTWTSSAGVAAEEVEALKSAFATLRINRMVDFGSEHYAVYGLDRASVATVTLTSGGAFTLHLSEGETEELIYLTIGEREIIYLVTCEDAETLLEYIRMSKTDG